jgi:hypothetical protein
VAGRSGGTQTIPSLNPAEPIPKAAVGVSFRYVPRDPEGVTAMEELELVAKLDIRGIRSAPEWHAIAPPGTTPRPVPPLRGDG